MIDEDCIALLQWLLPQLNLRWQGFRRVRRQVCRRFQRRIAQLGLDDAGDYRVYLQQHPEELKIADFLCRVTISRFYRDPAIFDGLAGLVLPELGGRAIARGAAELKVWSVGCASGEEPYTLALLWHFRLKDRLPGLEPRILGTDVDAVLLRRARAATYPRGSLQALPAAWLEEAFDRAGSAYRLRAPFRARVHFQRHDLRDGAPDHGFALVLCRNLAFTYFDEKQQSAAAATLAGCMRPGGALVLGSHECLPAAAAGFEPWPGGRAVYRRLRAGTGQ